MFVYKSKKNVIQSNKIYIIDSFINEQTLDTYIYVIYIRIE